MISPYHTLLTPLIALSPLIHVPLCNMGELGAVCDCVCSVFLVSFDCVWHVGGLVTLQASRTLPSRVGVLRPPTRAAPRQAHAGRRVSPPHATHKGRTPLSPGCRDGWAEHGTADGDEKLSCLFNLYSPAEAQLLT